MEVETRMGHVTVKLNGTCMFHFINNLNGAKDPQNVRILWEYLVVLMSEI